MRILIVGATGVLGRALLPHLHGHERFGTTRSAEKRGLVEALGARALVCDVYAPGALLRIAREVSPEVVVNFLTDLAGGPGPANERIRLEGGPVVAAAAVACGARRLVVESLAFDAGPSTAAAIAALEANAAASGLESVVLRFGRLWGPDTWSQAPPKPPAIHVSEAGRRAAELLLDAAPGSYDVVEPPPPRD
jgi:nucleoside-diphosphate-sugar epimerase